MSGQPARQYSWPPFEPGNAAALKHGADSEQRIRPVADRIVAELVAVAPWSAAPAFAATVNALARAEARVYLLTTWLDEHGLVDGDGETRPALAALERAESAAANRRTELGLTPVAWAALRRALTVDPDGGTTGADALRALGSQLLEAIEATTLDPPQEGEDQP